MYEIQKGLKTMRISWLGLALVAGASLGWAVAQSQGQEGQQERKEVRTFVVGQKAGAMGRLHLVQGKLLESHPEADLDRDGTLSLEERRAFEQVLAEKKMASLLEEHPEADLDADGRLSEEELAEFRQVQRQERMERILAEHPEADADGDGQLSRKELLHFRLQQTRELMTALKDESLSEAERQALIERIGGEGGLHSSHEGDFSFGDGQATAIFVSNDDLPFGELHESEISHVTIERVRAHGAKVASGVPFGEVEGDAAYFELNADGLEGDSPIRLKLDLLHRVTLKVGDLIVDELHLLDEDGDGYVELTLDKIRQLHERQSRDRRGELLKANPEADADGDGEISAEEARAFAAKVQAAGKKGNQN